MPAFRIHFENEHLDIDAPTAELARQRALKARPGQIITKSKLIDPQATKAAIKEKP